MAGKTIANFIEKASRLYEQNRRTASDATALEMYVRRWVRWANGGLVMPRAIADGTEGRARLGGLRLARGKS